MTAYTFDETHVRDIVEATGFVLAIDTRRAGRFPILDTELLPHGVIVQTSQGFSAKLRSDYWIVTSERTETEFIDALTRLKTALAATTPGEDD